MNEQARQTGSCSAPFAFAGGLGEAAFSAASSNAGPFVGARAAGSGARDAAAVVAAASSSLSESSKSDVGLRSVCAAGAARGSGARDLNRAPPSSSSSESANSDFDGLAAAAGAGAAAGAAGGLLLVAAPNALGELPSSSFSANSDAGLASRAAGAAAAAVSALLVAALASAVGESGSSANSDARLGSSAGVRAATAAGLLFAAPPNTGGESGSSAKSGAAMGTRGADEAGGAASDDGLGPARAASAGRSPDSSQCGCCVATAPPSFAAENVGDLPPSSDGLRAGVGTPSAGNVPERSTGDSAGVPRRPAPSCAVPKAWRTREICAVLSPSRFCASACRNTHKTTADQGNANSGAQPPRHAPGSRRRTDPPGRRP